MIGIRAIILFTVLTGLVYPLAVTVIAMALASDKASGSLVTKNETIVGSALIGQPFSQAQYFWPRPSAVHYDAAASGASNLSLSSGQLLTNIRERESQGAILEMRFASGSGLDPHISPEVAESQTARIGLARKLKADQMMALKSLIHAQTEARQFGFLGEPRVNVLRLNLEMDKQFGR